MRDHPAPSPVTDSGRIRVVASRIEIPPELVGLMWVSELTSSQVGGPFASFPKLSYERSGLACPQIRSTLMFNVPLESSTRDGRCELDFIGS